MLSTMSLPMITHDGTIGAMNLYAETRASLPTDDERIGLLFASQAAFLLANAQAYWDARTLSENLEQAMQSRATIEQAKGIIMSTMRCGADEAMQLLIRQSQDQNIKLRELAAELVRNAWHAIPRTTHGTSFHHRTADRSEASRWVSAHPEGLLKTG